MREYARAIGHADADLYQMLRPDSARHGNAKNEWQARGAHRSM
jgi:hypothetical protein